MSAVLSIAVAGMFGVLLRYFLSTWVDGRLAALSSSSIPWGTIVVNLLGCFVAGFLFHALFERTTASSPYADPHLRNALMVGFLGGFTTFSAYSIQTLSLLRSSQWLEAGLNVGVSNVGGIALAYAGYLLSRSL